MPSEKSTAELCEDIVLKIIELCEDQWDKVNPNIDDGFKTAISFSSDWGTGLTVALQETHFHIGGENFAALIKNLHSSLVEGVVSPNYPVEDIYLIEEPTESEDGD